MTHPPALRIIAVLLVCLPISAQQSGNLSFGGTVTDSVTGQPVRRARVIASKIPDQDDDIASRSNRSTPAAFTDSSGAFRITGLQSGRYIISAQKPGFTMLPSDARRDVLELKAAVDDFSIKLAPLGVIAGAVADQTGEPVRGINVIALTTSIENGFRRTRSVRSVSTDDRGRYRLWNLEPGKYYIKAAGRSGGTAIYTTGNPPEIFSAEAPIPTYFGGGSILDSATPIAVEPGSQAVADFALNVAPAYHVRGTLANYVPRGTVKFELLSRDEESPASRVILNGRTGAFDIIDVLPGEYTLRVTQEQMRFEGAVNVAAADVDGVVATLKAGSDIQVLTQVSERQKIGSTDAMRPFCYVALEPPGRRASDPQYASGPRASNTGLIAGVLPGTYRVRFNCYGGYVSSASSGNQDLLSNPVLVIRGDAEPLPIQIVISRGGGTVSGTLETEKAEPERVGVLLVPRSSHSAEPSFGYAYLRTAGSTSLVFGFAVLAPGSYLAYAFADGPAVEYHNPAFIRSLSGGVPVEIQDGAEAHVEIREVRQ